MGATPLSWRASTSTLHLPLFGAAPARSRHPLFLPSVELRDSLEWSDLLVRWIASPIGRIALDPAHPHSLESLSSALLSALHYLVALAGGWQSRPPQRRMAYDSTTLRAARRRLGLLHRLASLLLSPVEPSLGCWTRDWMLLLHQLAALGVALPETTVPLLLQLVEMTRRCRLEVDQLVCELRSVRHSRWTAALPCTWLTRLGVIFHWLVAAWIPWGTTPILDESGQQCTTVPAVDSAVRRYWVDTVLRAPAVASAEDLWGSFLASRLGPSSL